MPSSPSALSPPFLLLLPPTHPPDRQSHLPPYSGLDLDGDGLAEVDLSLFDHQTGDLNTPLLMLLLLLAALCVTLGTSFRSFRNLRRAMAGCRRGGRMVPVVVQHEVGGGVVGAEKEE